MWKWSSWTDILWFPPPVHFTPFGIYTGNQYTGPPRFQLNDGLSHRNSHPGWDLNPLPGCVSYYLASPSWVALVWYTGGVWRSLGTPGRLQSLLCKRPQSCTRTIFSHRNCGINASMQRLQTPRRVWRHWWHQDSRLMTTWVNAPVPPHPAQPGSFFCAKLRSFWRDYPKGKEVPCWKCFFNNKCLFQKIA